MGRVVKFLIDSIPRSAGPVNATIISLGVRVAALNHKTWNDPVKLGAVIEALAHEFLEIRNVVGRLVFEESNSDSSVVRGENGDLFADYRGCHSLYRTDVGRRHALSAI